LTRASALFARLLKIYNHITQPLVDFQGIHVLLEVKNLKVYYDVDKGSVRAVDGVSFSLGSGETLGVVGESGCGKSSLAGALLRILPSNARVEGDTVLFDGIDLLKLPEERMRREVRWKRIAMVFQGSMNALNPIIRVGDQIAEAILLHENGVSKKEALERAVELLEMVGLDRSTVRRYPFELSGGQRQRALIAMALALNPKLLIADEPTTALDVIVQAQLLKLLKGLQNKLKLSILFISHDVAVIASISDWVAVMYAGKIVEMGKAGDILLEPTHPYTQALVNAVPSIKETRKTFKFIAGQPPDLLDPPPGCRFHPRCPYANEKCRSEEPLHIEIGKEHYVACHLAGDRE